MVSVAGSVRNEARVLCGQRDGDNRWSGGPEAEAKHPEGLAFGLVLEVLVFL